MLAVTRTNRFKKDAKRMLKRGRSLAKLKVVVTKLSNQIPLSARHRDHTLTGKFNYARECHIEPDWLLIYTCSKKEIRLERTGTHSDLFE